MPEQVKVNNKPREIIEKTGIKTICHNHDFYFEDSGEVEPTCKEIEEILARIRALFRRLSIEEEARVQKQTILEYRDLVIEKENRTVRRNGELIDLTKREYELLLMLMENINVVLSREVLLNQVWGYKMEVETNVIDVYIRYLRNKIDIPGRESYIQTVRGTGYVMRR